MLNGADILVRCLQQERVEYVFGYPGGSVLYVYDSLFKQSEVKHILVRHEQAAAHAADGYARATGKVGVCLVTSGPGLTNAVTGIATAFMDSIPMVIISGQVPTRAIGQDSFQECDAIGITRPCVKHNFLVKDASRIPEIVKKAFFLAASGRPGPVLIDIPKDISMTPWEVDFSYPSTVKMRSYSPSYQGNERQIQNAAKQILKAQRPLVYFGGGIVLSETQNVLRELVRTLSCPCTSTLMGLGCYPPEDPLYLGMLGMHGTYEANMATQDCDLILAVGARFDDRVIGNIEHFLSQPRKVIHIDVDPTSISKRVKADIPIVGNLSAVLPRLLETLHQMQEPLGELRTKTPAWWQKISHWQASKCLDYNQDERGRIKPQQVVQTLSELTLGSAIVTSDVGQHQMWAAQYYQFKSPRQWLNSGGLGTMGVGLPYAMGAKLAFPQKDVFCITGEASIQMCIQELSTCKQYHLPIKIINLNNRYLGMVRQWQEMFHGNRYAESYVNALPNFIKLAESYGHVGLQISKPSEIKSSLEYALSLKDQLVFVDVLTNPEENVFPMVPNGKGLSETILSDHK